ncbi:MAG: SDR family oxidoreductase [Proteobacteria bacterium]|nr:SDR family oxidoreductase [Pseudomonadota bacterium]MCZ6782126.1 SDR family oxidoreductase [Pseudomonadota bacterium]
MSETALVVGASSGIGRAIAAALAASGTDLVLAGRNQEELARTAADLALRHGVKTSVRPFEALDFDSHPVLIGSCERLDGVMLCHGQQFEQEEAQADPQLARRMIDVNFTSAVSVLEAAARRLEAQGSGWISALSSVAGDRGRPSNYLYGASKGGLSTYLQGLDARLAGAGVRVLTVKPGFVDTGLTYGRPGLFLVASPEKVAADVVRALRRGRSVVYSPWFWWGILAILRAIPTRIFRRLSL